MTHTASFLRLIGAFSIAAVIASGLISLPEGDTSLAAGRYRSRTRRVAPGVSLTRMVDRRGPNRISVLRVNLARTTFDVALAKDALPGLQTTSSMARQAGAIAAVNGDYFLTHGHEWMGRPVNTYAEDGELKASPMIWGRNVAPKQDESDAYFGHFALDIALTEYDTGQVHRIHDWNAGPPRSNRLAGFTSAGGSAMTPSPDACAVRLYPSAEMQWHRDSEGVVQDYVVHKTRCSTAPMSRRGGVVIAGGLSSTPGLVLTQSVLPGETVRLSWSLGFPEVLDTIGGNPLLVEDGRLAAGPCDNSGFCARNPRTGAGLTAGGRLLLVVVDGRRKKSVGMTPAQFARLFRYLGARDAINLDGGGSSTMWVKGRIVNRPSDGHERRVGNALLVLPFADSREPPMAPTPPSTPPPYTPSPTPTPTPSSSPSGLLGDLPHPPPGALSTFASACSAATDPASIGGYLDFVYDRDRRSLRRPLRRTLSIFEGTSGTSRCL